MQKIRQIAYCTAQQFHSGVRMALSASYAGKPLRLLANEVFRSKTQTFPLACESNGSARVVLEQNVSLSSGAAV